MQEGKQSIVGLLVDAQVVDPMTAGREPVRLKTCFLAGWERPQYLSAALAKHDPVTMLVGGMDQVQSTQQGIRGHFRGADQIAASIGLRLPKAQQLARAPFRIVPDPAVDRTEQFEYHKLGIKIVLKSIPPC